MNKKKQKQKRRMIRAIIQVMFFVLAPAVFTSAFSGVKYLFIQIGKAEHLEAVSFLSILVSVSLYTIVFGRFFCGFACAFGSFGDLLFGIVSGIQKKWGKKLPRIKESWMKPLMNVKYIILAGILGCCFLGIYGNFSGSSPWDVFSMLTSLNFKFGGYGIGIIVLLLIGVGMCIEERFFCKFLCPMGAVFALLPILPFSQLRRDREGGIPKCSRCQRECIARIEIDRDNSRAGECIQCNKCMDVCPKGNIGIGIWKLKGNETWFLVGKAGLLLVLFWGLGCIRISF